MAVFNCKNADDVLRAVKDYNVSFIQFWFIDILGVLKSFQITPKELEASFEEGMGFDGSSIVGFTSIQESDMVAFPDPATFQLVAWRPSERPVARMFCDIKTPEGASFAADSRFILKKMLQKAAAKGYTYYVGPELEFFLFASSTEPKILDRGGYFDAPPLDLANDVRRDIIFALESMGVGIEYSHHEVAPSQHEIDMRYAEGLVMADTTVTYRVVVKEIARKHGCYGSFMPKPLYGENGSGMHCHQSLFKGSKNAFFDAAAANNLSKEGKSYIAGLLKHAPEFSLVTNQWVNSYKRLVPGYEAPVYIAWAQRNRSALVRVPMYKPGKEAATRIELRCPDPACNPYLAFAVMLGAGLKGIEDNYELPGPIEENIFKMSEAEMAAKGIAAMPGSLHEAVVNLEHSALMKDVLGDHLHAALVANKKREWDEYRTQVTQYEIDKYLPTL
jgi:glutamine synthetase